MVKQQASDFNLLIFSFRSRFLNHPTRKFLTFAFCIAMLFGILAGVASAQVWSASIEDPSDVHPGYDIRYDILRASANHDGSIFSVEIEFRKILPLPGWREISPSGSESESNSNTANSYKGIGVRIKTINAQYVLGFCTSSECWGPKLAASYVSLNGWTTWQLISGSFGGELSSDKITLWVNISDIGNFPWTIDFISGVVFSATEYKIEDSTVSITVPTPPLLLPGQRRMAA